MCLLLREDLVIRIERRVKMTDILHTRNQRILRIVGGPRIDVPGLDVSMESVGITMTGHDVRNVSAVNLVMDSSVLREHHVRWSLTLPEERLYTELCVRMIPRRGSVLRSIETSTQIVILSVRQMVTVVGIKNAVTMDVDSPV